MNARLPTRGRFDAVAIAVAVLTTVVSFGAVFSWFDPKAYGVIAVTSMQRRAPRSAVPSRSAPASETKGSGRERLVPPGRPPVPFIIPAEAAKFIRVD